MTQPRKRSAKRGPRTDIEAHANVFGIVEKFGDNWTAEDNLFEICQELDQRSVPIPKTWPTLKDRPARSWQRALEYHKDLVKKAIRYHCEAASTATQMPLTFSNS